jgi:hypothetical protein
MKEQNWTFTDKSQWERGPWDDEPDKLQFTDETTGLACLIHRAGVTGSLCGYVGVPDGHPWHGKSYEDIGARVHGGLTFSDFCDEDVSEDGIGICHIPEPGEPARLWWVGFDCGHAGDMSPAMDARIRARDRLFSSHGWETYRTLDYVRAECAELASQAAEVAP